MSDGTGSMASHGVLAKLSWALRSEAGDVRPVNHDAAGAYAPTTPDDAWDRGPLFVVADGAGGAKAVEAALASWAGGRPPAPAQALVAAARDANAAVAANGAGRGAGPTLTALTLAGREALWAHVGDSRLYLARAGDCRQLTPDHTRAGEMLRARTLTAEAAAVHPGRSQLTRSLGGSQPVPPDAGSCGLEAGDTFVLCSDGLWDVVGPEELAVVASDLAVRALPTPAEAADRLIDLALARGAPDNVTAVVVLVKSDRPIPAAAVPVGRRSRFRRR